MYWHAIRPVVRPLYRLFSVFLIGITPIGLLGHTTFLRPLEYEDSVGEEREILIFNGTFEESVDSIPSGRVSKILVSKQDGIEELSQDKWIRGEVGSFPWRVLQKVKPYLGGIDHRRTSTVKWTPETDGCFLLGVELHPARVAMKPETFEAYLAEVGLQDETHIIRKADEPGQIIRERYTKTAKSILYAGKANDGIESMNMGLVAEIVPLTDPASLDSGDSLEVILLLHGQPLPDQIVIVSRQGGIAEDSDGRLTLRSGKDGKLTIPIHDNGEWWLEFNHMKNAPPEDEVDYITFWTTLTFKV